MILPLPPSDVFVPPPPSSSLLRQISSLHLSSAYIRPPVAAPPRLLPPSPPRMCLSLHAALSRSPRPLFCPALHDLISLPPPGQKGDDLAHVAPPPGQKGDAPDLMPPPPGQKGGRWMNTSPLRDRRATRPVWSPPPPGQKGDEPALVAPPPGQKGDAPALEALVTRFRLPANLPPRLRLRGCK